MNTYFHLCICSFNLVLYFEFSNLRFISFVFNEQDPGEHSPEKRVRDVRPSRPPFHASPAIRKPPVEAEVRSQDPHFKEKCYIFPPKFLAPEAKIWPRFSSKSLKILQNIHSQAPVFDENSLTRPYFHGNLTAHKPPSSEIQAAHTYQNKG